jgi:hypothetical protein
MSSILTFEINLVFIFTNKVLIIYIKKAQLTETLYSNSRMY